MSDVDVGRTEVANCNLLPGTPAIKRRGTGKITFTDYFVNRTGLRTKKGGLSGTYSLDEDGRVTASVHGVTKTLVMCLISNGSGYLMIEDTGAEEPRRLGSTRWELRLPPNRS
jgi:hypothetical protein